MGKRSFCTGQSPFLLGVENGLVDSRKKKKEKKKPKNCSTKRYRWAKEDFHGTILLLVPKPKMLA